MKSIRILAVLLSIGLLAVGCSQEPEMTAPDTQLNVGYDKNGTETLGPPTIDIAGGSCYAQGGVGMVGLTEGTLEINVPAGTINQVLLYWAGGTTGAPGDDMIKIDGNDVTGELIGGETEFFQSGGASYYFWAYRADITDLGLVANGDNSFTISDFNFDWTGGNLDENNGIGMMVIYDDGTPAEITVLDGLDLAFFRFDAPLDATVPQTFDFAAATVERSARLVIFAGSVGFGRPNDILLTTSAGTDTRSDLLGSTDGPLWDTLCLTDIIIPAGDTSLTVELVSPPVENPLGASLAWVGAGLSLPTEETYCIGDYVWYDENRDGCQGPDEMPVEGVEVNLWAGCPPSEVIATTVTDAAGYYAFCDLLPGDYTVQFVAPEGYYFCEQYSDACDPATDSNAGEDGITDCVTIVDADDWTIDAALCMPVELACIGDYVWHDMNEDGIQDGDEAGVPDVTVYLEDCQGNVLDTTMTDSDGLYMFCELEPGNYNVRFMLPGGYVFSPQNQGGDDALDSDADPQTGTAACTTLDPGEHDMTWDAGVFMPPVIEEVGCRMTGGGNDEFFFEDGTFNEYTFGGQAGAPLASEPQPWGNWTHHQKKGPAGSFTFHAGTPSAPEGTEIDWIECMDPGWCVQARKAPAKQLDFAGVGTFKNMKGAPEWLASKVDVKGRSLHWFEVNIDDLGEPGSHSEPEGCDPLGFGRNGGTELADCGCPDFYRIRIYEGMDDSSPILYEVYGYIDGGNFQIHPPTGRDAKLWN